jgi:hypothetical protein
MFAAPFLQFPLFGATKRPIDQPFPLLTVLCDDAVAPPGLKRGVPDMGSGVLGGEQHLFHLIGPPAAFDLDDKIEIAKEMRMTLLMAGGGDRVVLRRPAIMPQIALIRFAKMLFDDFIAAMRMDRIVDGLGMLPNPQPPPLAGHPEAGFITADPCALPDLVEKTGHERLRRAVRLGQDILHAAFGHGKSTQILTDLGQTLIGHEVRDVQGDQESTRPRADLDRCRHLVRKVPLVPAAAGTDFREGLMFDHRHLNRWNLAHLTPRRHRAGRGR